MTEKEQAGAESGEANVCGGRTDDGVEEMSWPRFGWPLVEPAGGGEPVKESELTWLGDLDE